MQFYVQQAVLDAGVKILFATIEGLDNHGSHPEWDTLRERELTSLFHKYGDLDVHQDPILEGFNLLHDKTGVRRRKNVPASENLIKQLLRHGHMTYINQVVDIYNLISLESKLALGAHDIDRVDGNVTLRFTEGTERFQPIGQPEPQTATPHEYSYIDDAGDVLCRLEIRQVQKTLVTEATRNVFYIIQGNEATPDQLLRETAQQIIDTTTHYCGGQGHFIEPQVIESERTAAC